MMSDDSDPGPWRPTNGTDGDYLYDYCDGCKHFGEAGEGCDIILGFDLGEYSEHFTATIGNGQMHCTKREES